MNTLRVSIILFILFSAMSGNAQTFDCKVFLAGKDFREIRDGLPMGSILAKSFTVNVEKEGGKAIYISSSDVNSPPFDNALLVIVTPVYTEMKSSTLGLSLRIDGVQLILDYSSSNSSHKFFATSSAPVISTRIFTNNAKNEFNLVGASNRSDEPGLDGASLRCYQILPATTARQLFSLG